MNDNSPKDKVIKQQVPVSPEQNHVIDLALKSALPPIFESGNLCPTLFVHDDKEVRYFSMLPNSLEDLREMAKETLAKKCSAALAYAFIYDATFDKNGTEVDALIIESADINDEESIELVVCYNRKDKTHDDMIFSGKQRSFFMMIDRES